MRCSWFDPFDGCLVVCGRPGEGGAGMRDTVVLVAGFGVAILLRIGQVIDQPLQRRQQLRRGLAQPLRLEVNGDGLLAGVVADHIHQGGEGFAVAVVDAVGGGRVKVAGLRGGFLWGGGLDAREEQPHFPVSMNVVEGHGLASSTDRTVLSSASSSALMRTPNDQSSAAVSASSAS